MSSNATRSLIVFVVLLLIASAPGVFAHESVGDVPPDHWAYEAVKELLDRGYLSVEDGHFQGDEAVDRFTLATVVARILHEIETGAVAPQSERDVELLRSVVNEFRSDLVDAYTQIDDVAGQVEQNEKSIRVVEDKMTEIIHVIAEIMDEIVEQDASLHAALQAEALKLRTSISNLAGLLEDDQEAMRDEVRAMIASLDGTTDARISALEQSLLGDVEETLGTQSQTIIEVDERLRDESVRLDSLEALLKGLGTDLSGLTSGIEEAVRELRSEMNAQSESMAVQQLSLQDHERLLADLENALADHEAAMKRQGDALVAADGELLKGVEGALRQVEDLRKEMGGSAGRLESMKAQIDGVERQVLAMQSQIGLSEDQLAALSDRLMNELESQYQHSFLLAGTVSDELDALKKEFRSYRQQTEQELAGAKSAQTFGMIGAVLGLIGLLSGS